MKIKINFRLQNFENDLLIIDYSYTNSNKLKFYIREHNEVILSGDYEIGKVNIIPLYDILDGSVLDVSIMGIHKFIKIEKQLS